MNCRIRQTFLITLLIKSIAFSHFESAVLTLDFPAGAENTGLGETGVSNANTVYSVFFNPANTASLYEETYSNIIYSSFHEEVLPALVSGIYHDYSTFALSFEKVLPFIDVGYTYFNNYLNFGQNVFTDSNGIEIDTFSSDERVISNCLGIKAFDFVSFGLSFKNYNSRLAPGMGGILHPKDGIAKGYAIDIGLKINRKLHFFDFVNINPAFGISALNLGNDSAVYIVSSGYKDPLPKKCYTGISCEINLLDFIGYTFIYDVDFYLLHKIKDEWNDRTKHVGYKIQLTPFYSVLNGKMDDPVGQRHEKTEGYTLTFNFQKTLDVVFQAITLYDKMKNTNFIDGLKKRTNSLSFNNFKFKPNFFYSKSHSVITVQEPHHVRDGQTRDDWTIGVGIIASFPNCLQGKNNHQKNNDSVNKNSDEIKSGTGIIKSSETDEDEVEK